MRWVSWGRGVKQSLSHVYAGGTRTACGVVLGPSPRFKDEPPERGGACGSCMEYLAGVERFAAGARAAQRGEGQQEGS